MAFSGQLDFFIYAATSSQARRMRGGRNVSLGALERYELGGDPVPPLAVVDDSGRTKPRRWEPLQQRTQDSNVARRPSTGAGCAEPRPAAPEDSSVAAGQLPTEQEAANGEMEARAGMLRRTAW